VIRSPIDAHLILRSKTDGLFFYSFLGAGSERMRFRSAHHNDEHGSSAAVHELTQWLRKSVIQA
jgi:hypothetical protein